MSEASVGIDGHETARIGAGLLVMIGVVPTDGEPTVTRLLERVLNYRVFSDAAGKMNFSLRQTAGGLLLVPQFTLTAETRQGRRPGFPGAASPELGRRLFESMVAAGRQSHGSVASGRFGADMQVALVNDGPVTFWLEE